MINPLLKNGKCLLLAYDQGFEHGPVDFNQTNVDPNYILKIAQESGMYTGIVFHEGIAEKYYGGAIHESPLPPLVIKLNGKTAFHKGEEPLSLQLTSVAKAQELGAVGVGYTIYVGSEHEEQMLVEFRRICDEAHAKKLVTIAWLYPRGRHVEGRETAKDVVAYAARLGLELGADMIKVPYTGDPESFSWIVQSAGRTQVLAQGGERKPEAEFLMEVRGIMAAGATGMAIGRNIWQSDKPVELSKKVAEIVFKPA